MIIRIKNDRPKDIAQSYSNLAVCYLSLDDVDSAENYIKLAIDYAEQASQPKLYHQYHDNYGNILQIQKKHKEAEEAYLKALNVPDELKEANARSQFFIYSNLIDVYNDTQDFSKALNAIKNAMNILDKDSTLFMISKSVMFSRIKIALASLVSVLKLIITFIY